MFTTIVSFLLGFPVLFFVFSWDDSWGPWPWGWETWLWRMKARGSEVLHEQRLCAISKPTKLSPLAVVWTLVWWELVCLVYLFVVMVSEGGNPPTQLALGSRVAGGQVIQRRSVMGSSLSPPRVGGCANFLTDGFVWLPCPTLLKSPCPETIHQNPPNNMFTN